MIGDEEEGQDVGVVATHEDGGIGVTVATDQGRKRGQTERGHGRQPHGAGRRVLRAHVPAGREVVCAACRHHSIHQQTRHKHGLPLGGGTRLGVVVRVRRVRRKIGAAPERGRRRVSLLEAAAAQNRRGRQVRRAVEPETLFRAWPLQAALLVRKFKRQLLLLVPQLGAQVQQHLDRVDRHVRRYPSRATRTVRIGRQTRQEEVRHESRTRRIQQVRRLARHRNLLCRLQHTTCRYTHPRERSQRRSA
jgi:hypothetical protein